MGFYDVLDQILDLLRRRGRVTYVGQTAHLAARMEQLALPGSIRLTAATLRLVEGLVSVLQGVSFCCTLHASKKEEIAYEIWSVLPIALRARAA
jgi:class 3 adenylate cyclase